MLGVIFQDNQVAGACMAWITCAIIMAYFAFARPYLYAGGNYLSVASYGSLLAAYTHALVDKLEHGEFTANLVERVVGERGYGVSQGFNNLLFFAWMLPYLLAVADLVNVLQAFTHCSRRGRFFFSQGPDVSRATSPGSSDGRGHLRAKNPTTSWREQEKKTRDTFSAEHKRGMYILSTLQSLLPIVRGVVHAAGTRTHAKLVGGKPGKHKSTRTKKNKDGSNLPPPKAAWDKRRDSRITLALAVDLETQLHSMIEAFSNGSWEGGVGGGRDGGGGGGGGGEEDKGRASSLTGNYRPLYWHHFVATEKAASQLSQAAFPFTHECVRQASTSGIKGRPGAVRKCFAQRYLLWGTSVTESLRLEQEEARRIEATTKSITGQRVSRGLHPHVKDIGTWREVLTAMLKPRTDFGWYGASDDMSDAARALLIKRESHHAGAVGESSDEEEEKGAESKVQIYDDGAGEVAIEMAHIGRGNQQSSGSANISPTSNSGSILQHVAKHLRSDPEVVLEAARRDHGEIRHAAAEELNAIEVLSAIKGDRSSSIIFKDADGEVEAHM